jgi:two-component system invasion response regulator UvrY
MPGMIRVLVVNHNPLMRDGLVLLIRLQADMELAAVATTSEQAVQLYREQRPDIVLLDLDLPRNAAFDAIRGICAVHAGACLIGLATYREESVWKEALAAGVRRCASKDGLSETLPGIIRLVDPDAGNGTN